MDKVKGCYHKYMMNQPNNHYVYIWKEPGVAGSGLPFYVGQGTHMKGTRYFRSVERHVSNSMINGKSINRRDARPTFCQKKADKLARLGTPHEVVIHTDNLTQEEANDLEILLISRLGRRDLGTGILCNLTDGGHTNNFTSPITRYNHLKAVRSEANRQRVSTWVRDRLKDPTIRQNHLDALDKHRKRRRVEHNGKEYLSVAELSETLGIKPATVLQRVNAGRDPSREMGGNKRKILYDGVEYNSLTELAKAYDMPYGMLQVRLKSGIPLDAPYHTKKIRWNDKTYNGVRELADELGWSMNAVKARVVDGVFVYSELKHRNKKK